MYSKLLPTTLFALFTFLNLTIAQSDKPLNSRLYKEYQRNKTTFTTSAGIDSLIYDLIEDVSADSVEYFIQSLQNFGTRYYNASNRRHVSEWIMNKFSGFGIEDVKLDSFSLGNSWQYNVVAAIPAAVPADKVVVIGAHHDSITGSSSLSDAPGADDNASGTAGVLEIARVLADNNYMSDANLVFVTFAAEEIGLYGSRDFAKKAKDSGMDIRLMINHDMISYSPFPVENSRVAVNHYSGSEGYADIAMYCIDNFTPMQPYRETLNSQYSDSWSFHQQGFNAVYFEEHDFTPYYHTTQDRIEHSNIPFCTEIIKASCATLIYSLTVPQSVRDVVITDQGSGSSLYVQWQDVNEEDFKEYKVHVGESPGDYNRVMTTSSNNITIEGLTSGTEYFVGISVVDTDGYESSIIEQSYIPFLFTLDQGVLIVDETDDGSGELMKPTDEEVDNYYASLLSGFPSASYDLIKSGDLSVKDIGSYSTIIWHGDDLRNQTAPLKVVEELKRFMDAGGNFIYSGYQPARAFQNNTSFETEFGTGDFIYDYLKIEKMKTSPGTRFSGAISNTEEYEDLYVDTSKIDESLSFQLQKIESISANSAAENIFSYDSEFDTSSVQGVLEGLPVAVEYMGDDYKAVTLSFPLYYMNAEQAGAFLSKVLEEKFGELTDIEETANIPHAFELSQNYPNPFNPTTTIEYSVPVKVNSESSMVKLIIYDILGREVAELVDGYKSAGRYKVSFNAEALTSGVYFYTLKAGNYVESKKMIVVK
jgi:hypothetical protein